jgi:hypothetical protein
MDIIHTICPICKGTNLELKQVEGYYHGFQTCLGCHAIIGFKMIDRIEYDKEVLMADIVDATKDCKEKIKVIESMTRVKSSLNRRSKSKGL